MFQPLRICFVEILSKLFKKHRIFHKKDLYNVAIDNVMKFANALAKVGLDLFIEHDCRETIEDSIACRKKDVKLRSLFE